MEEMLVCFMLGGFMMALGLMLGMAAGAIIYHFFFAKKVARKEDK